MKVCRYRRHGRRAFKIKCVTKELDTLLTALYVLIDDHVVAGSCRVVAVRPVLSDSELITYGGSPGAAGLSTANGAGSVMSAAVPSGVAMFPYLAGPVGLPQAVEEQRSPLLCKAILTLAACSSVLVRRPVDDRRHPGALRHVTRDGETLGPGRARRLRLLRVALPLVLGPEALPGLHRRRDADHVVPGQPQDRGTRGGRRPAATTTTTSSAPGRLLLADKGFAGKEFKQLTDAMGLRLLRPDRKDETYRNGNLGGVRQWIESVNQTLKSQLDLEDHGARTPARSVHPRRTAPTGHGHRDLAQLDHRRHQQTLTDRLRPLTPTSRNHSSSRFRAVRVALEDAWA